MPSLRPLLLAAACLTASVGAPHAAQAQAQAQPNPVSISAAEALFEEGRNALGMGDLDLACARFRESNRLDPAVGTVLNLADCEEKRGKLATAWMLFRRAATELDPADDRLSIVQERLAELEAKLPRLVLELGPGAATETRAHVAGTDLGNGSFGVPLPLDPGAYEIVVSAPGKRDKTYFATLAEGQVERVVIAAGPDKVPSAPPETEGGLSRRDWTYVIGGAGVAGLGVGIVAGVMTLGQKSIADDNCNDEARSCNARGQDANETGRTLGAISTIGFVVGVAGLGAATYLWLTEPQESQATALRASIGANSASLSFERRF